MQPRPPDPNPMQRQPSRQHNPNAVVEQNPQHDDKHDADSAKGAVEQDRPGQPTNVSMEGQLSRRSEGEQGKPESGKSGREKPGLEKSGPGNSNDTDFPGSTPEHGG